MSNKLKICFITYSVFSIGGAQRVVSVLSNEIKDKYSIEILCIDGNYKDDRLQYNLNPEIKVKICPEISEKRLSEKIGLKIIKILHKNTCILDNTIFDNIIERAYYPINIQNRLVEYINRNNFDIIIGVEGYFSVLVGLISNKIKSKTIGWEHSSYEAYLNTNKRYYWKQDRIFKKALLNLYKHIVLTKEDKEAFENKLQIESITINNPLSFKSFEKTTCDKKNILFVGRLVEQKGVEFLIDAFKIVSQKEKEWNLIIVGDGVEKKYIQNKVRKYDIEDRVTLIGDTNEVKKYYLNSSIFVSSSIIEGFGIAIIEAMECGLPVVAFENSGPKEIIDKNYKNGILVEVKNIDDLSKAILYLIENDTQRKTMSLEAIKRAKDFELPCISSKWEKILNEVSD